LKSKPVKKGGKNLPVSHYGLSEKEKKGDKDGEGHPFLAVFNYQREKKHGNKAWLEPAARKRTGRGLEISILGRARPQGCGRETRKHA